jgi:hypothetical protein
VRSGQMGLREAPATQRRPNSGMSKAFGLRSVRLAPVGQVDRRGRSSPGAGGVDEFRGDRAREDAVPRSTTGFVTAEVR